jgi:membrane protease YdiL (CAAX protease family)
VSTVTTHDNAWTRFWNQGDWWRAVLLIAGYLVIYVGGGLLIGQLVADRLSEDGIFADTQTVAWGLLAPLALGAVALTAFVASVGWFRSLFAPQPIRGRGWMWVAPVAVAVAVVLRLLGIDYASYASGVVALTFLSGAFIGFVEEIVTRGIAVKMLRDAGRSEWVVMAVSSLLFALMHATNAFSGQALGVVAATVGFTFGFGICMYLVLRVTGNLIWPMILHCLYDPTLFLATGGIDVAAEGEQSAFLTAAVPANIVFLLIAVVALVAVRGRVRARAPLTGSVETR